MPTKQMPSNNALPEIDYEAFRDTIGTVDQSGKRRWVHPKKPKGPWHNRRAVVAVILLSLLFIGPFLEMNGRPMFLFNLLERKFIIFGLAFWPQDFHLLALSMITFFVFIVLFTVVFGRLWCGWACPQTLFMEFVFRKIEYMIDGDRAQQIKLARAPWNAQKIYKRSLKWGIFLSIAFIIGNWMMMYLVGKSELLKMVQEGPAAHMGLFSGVVVFTGLFFFTFAYLREQACIAICPYGRLQSVLMGKDSMMVAYDHKRGEPRERVRKNQVRQGGDCISCTLCVQVCPTGIDIRDGSQMECVNCTVCMDACDEVMDKVGFKKGLIRLTSHNQIETGQGFRFTPRVIAYSVVLTILLAVVGISLGSRQQIEATILRTPGTLTQTTQEGHLSNLYNYQIVNKTMEGHDLQFRVLKPSKAKIRLVGQAPYLEEQDIVKGALFVDIPTEEVTDRKTRIILEVYTVNEAGDEVLLDKVKTNFLGPLVL